MTGRGGDAREPVPGHGWLLTPVVAVLLTTLGAAAGVGLQTNLSLGLGSCPQQAFLGCGLLAVAITALTIMLAIAVSLVAGVRSRPLARPGGAAVRGLWIALPCLSVFAVATALASLVVG